MFIKKAFEISTVFHNQVKKGHKQRKTKIKKVLSTHTFSKKWTEKERHETRQNRICKI